MPQLEPGRIRVRNVSRRFRHYHERNRTLKETLLRRRRAVSTDLWVLRDVNLDVAPGEALGVVGRNGIGKSTLLKLVAGIFPPQSGTIEAGGRLASLLELGAGFHPDFNGRENVYMQGALYGLDEDAVDERIDEIVAFAELADFIEMPVKTYSSGMFMRLAFAIAAHVDADIMLLDEVLAVGDAAFQRKCLGRIFEFQRGGGTILFVSHDQEAVESVCTRAILLDDGRIVAEGTAVEITEEYNRRLAGRGRLDTGPEASAEVEAAESWGTGRVQIRDFRMIGPDGPTNRLSSGEPARVELDVVPQESVDTPVFGVELHGPGGVLLFSATTRAAGLTVGALDTPRTVSFSIPRLPLLEGSFALSLSAKSADESEIYHHIPFCVEFAVFQQSSGSGPLLVEGSWDLGPSPGSQADASEKELATESD